ncbi:MAG TPA: chemotaxis protein CheD [Rhodocyclaceae bacterium]|nr:chemotaxis protein CheD [Rhodocyclaceae bacterium]
MSDIAAATLLADDDIYLNPGDLWFGGGHMRLRTVLGSCVSVTLWHPRRHVGGMCHFMLPVRGGPRNAEPLSGKYADEAFRLFDAKIAIARTQPSEYRAKVFGGGNMFPKNCCGAQANVGLRNVEKAFELLAARDIDVVVEHVGGAGHRKVMFDVWSGDAWLNFQDIGDDERGARWGA